MLNIHVQAKRWERAMALAESRGLGVDNVRQMQWNAEPEVTEESLRLLDSSSVRRSLSCSNVFLFFFPVSSWPRRGIA